MAQIRKNGIASRNVRTERDRNRCAMHVFFRFVSSLLRKDLETDSLDAVKAFTQSDVDRELYVAMPVGFAIAGYCLKLLKALEGIKQGSYLWFQKNKWAWNKCGCYADLIEPTLYTHEKLRIIIAVFADDVGAGYKKAIETDWLRIRNEYSKLIVIDSPGPETIVPVTKFTGVNIERNRAARTLRRALGQPVQRDQAPQARSS